MKEMSVWRCTGQLLYCSSSPLSFSITGFAPATCKLCPTLMPYTPPPHRHQRRVCHTLTEVGVLEAPKLHGKYETGQLFLHKVFGYRGVVLFPWVGKLFDREMVKHGIKRSDYDLEQRPEYGGQQNLGDVNGFTCTYYQVLIDMTDLPHAPVHESATKLLTYEEGVHGKTTPVLVEGIDYASHEDIIPYRTQHRNPIMNDLFHKLLASDDDTGQYTAQEYLREWHANNLNWMELHKVHRETTHGVRVTVIPFNMPSTLMEQQPAHWWRYTIRIENQADDEIQLRKRHWRIYSAKGSYNNFTGRGVVGKEPVFNKNTTAFQFSSHVHLDSPSGHMWGTFHFENVETGTEFEVRIPPFMLESSESSLGQM